MDISGYINLRTENYRDEPITDEINTTKAGHAKENARKIVFMSIK